MKRYGILMGVLFFMINTTTSAQQLSLKPLSFLGVATNLGGEYYYDGGGFELAYQHDLWKGRVIGGLEYRMVNWGNQVGVNFGYNMPFWTKGQWRASVSVQTQFSWALFYQKSLLVWGIECIPEIEWHSNKAFFATLGFGIRYTNCPAYQNYGDIHNVIDLPIKIGLGFYLNNKKRKQ
jgi:hypothetical protein